MFTLIFRCNFRFRISFITCNDSGRNCCRRINILPSRRIHGVTGW